MRVVAIVVHLLRMQKTDTAEAAPVPDLILSSLGRIFIRKLRPE